MASQSESCTRYDVVVVGGGPAGSTAAALLAKRGEKVLLLDKDHHPRFHIGESLLPMNIPLLQELGVLAEVEAIGMPKYGVEFVSPRHETPMTLDFAQGWDKQYSYSYQVRRSDFDHILIRNAQTRGAEVIEGMRVTDVAFPNDADTTSPVVVTGRDEDGQDHRFEARFVVDASGRDTLLAGKLAIKQRNPRHKSAAVYGHFTGAHRLADKKEGNISVFWFEHGWIWFIPLSDNTTSIGAVCSPEFIKSRKTDVTTFLHSLIAQAPALAERLKDATICGEAQATGNYSYRADRMTGSRFVMLGDAFAFIDPVFSTGVFLAMKGAFLGVEAVTAALHASPAKALKARLHFEAEVRQSLASFSWYIYRMNRPAMRDLFMAPRNFFRVQEALLSLLSGDVFGRSPIHSRLLLFKGLYYIKSGLMKAARALAEKGWGGPKPAGVVQPVR